MILIYGGMILSLIIVLGVFIYILHQIGKTKAIERYERLFDATIGKIPFIEIVYNTAMSVFAFAFGSAIKDEFTVVMVRNNALNCDVLGLITRTKNNDLYLQDGKIAVYIPTSYNVGTGLVILMDIADVTLRQDLSPQKIFRFVTVGGFGMDNVSLTKNN